MSAQAPILVPGAPAVRHPGFKPAARGTRARGDATLLTAEGWRVLVHRKPFVGDPLADLAGAPGLWRAVPGSPPGARRRGGWSYVFEIPPGVAVSEGEGESTREAPPVELLEWARSTSGGTPPDPARAPERDEVESWIAPTRRHVRAGPHLAALELHAGGERLALSAPALVRLPAGLSPARQAWVRELCQDAQGRWRLARFHVDDERVGAEVDLSGAPPECAQVLLEVALAALTTAAAWVLPALVLAADPRVASRLLDRPPSRDVSRP
jgi:hypothetical protein